jgi:addiction module RelB/DinJ family antitoxin
MADATVTIRVDENVKRRFEEFCTDVGMNMSVAVNLFIRASLKEQRIPFAIESSNSTRGLELIRSMRAEAESRGFLSDDVINAEIQAARADKKASGAVVVTGNKKHYPNEPIVLTPAEFIEGIES